MKLSDFNEILFFISSKQNGGNLAFHVDDDPVIVDKNHQELSNKLGYDHNTLVHMKQIHSDIVKCVDSSDCYQTPPTCDALMTNKSQIPLMVMVADCSPLFFYDPICKAIAVVHAGRAGAFSNIVSKTVLGMKNEFSSKCEDIIVYIGPAIGVCCYEVGEEIYETYKESFGYAFTCKDGRWFLDVNSIIVKQLQEAGIKDENIENPKTCTSCTTQNYFSYRAEGKTGRFAGILMFK